MNEIDTILTRLAGKTIGGCSTQSERDAQRLAREVKRLREHVRTDNSAALANALAENHSLTAQLAAAKESLRLMSDGYQHAAEKLAGANNALAAAEAQVAELRASEGVLWAKSVGLERVVLASHNEAYWVELDGTQPRFLMDESHGGGRFSDARNVIWDYVAEHRSAAWATYNKEKAAFEAARGSDGK